MNTFLHSKLVIIPLVLFVAALAWWGLTSSETQLITVDLKGNAPEQQLLDSLSVLNNLDLEGGIFKDPTYAGLNDFSTPIIPEPIGRENPFAPLTERVDPSAPATAPAANDNRRAVRIFTAPQSQGR